MLRSRPSVPWKRDELDSPGAWRPDGKARLRGRRRAFPKRGGMGGDRACREYAEGGARSEAGCPAREFGDELRTRDTSMSLDGGFNARFDTAAPHHPRRDDGGCGVRERGGHRHGFRFRGRSEWAARRRRDGRRSRASSLPMTRTAQTSANGTYQFDYLPPGLYTIELDKPGIGVTRRSAIVDVGKNTQVDLVLGLAVKEELVVTVATPAVDVRSTEVSFNFKSDTLTALPLDRTYRGLFQLIPGVADNRSQRRAGRRRQSAGQHVSDRRREHHQSRVRLSEHRGERARHHRSESQTRRHHRRIRPHQRHGDQRRQPGRLESVLQASAGSTGSRRLWSAPTSCPTICVRAGVKVGTFRDPLLTTEIGPALGLGGPVVKDHVFFYGSARYFARNEMGPGEQGRHRRCRTKCARARSYTPS